MARLAWAKTAEWKKAAAMLTHARIQARQNLSDHEVLTLLNFELFAYEECTSCHFTSVELAEVVDGTRCNWRGTDLEVEGQMTDAARRITRRVVDEVRETYSIEWQYFRPQGVDSSQDPATR